MDRTPATLSLAQAFRSLTPGPSPFSEMKMTPCCQSLLNGRQILPRSGRDPIGRFHALRRIEADAGASVGFGINAVSLFF